MSAREAANEARQGGSEALGQLTAAAAHEFKNLLLVISGITELVLERTDLELSARSDLEEIRRATEQAEQLAQRLAALVQKPTARPRAVAPNPLLFGLERLFGRLLGEKIVLRVDLAEGLGCVFVDPIELQQALLNLVLNARDALSHGGELCISTGRVELPPGTPGTLRPGRYVALRVSDDGAGMNEETRTRVLEPYFTTKEPGRGSGLGLALVRSFVARAGGEIHVRSGLGAGTTVELLLPELEAQRPG